MSDKLPTLTRHQHALLLHMAQAMSVGIGPVAYGGCCWLAFYGTGFSVGAMRVRPDTIAAMVHAGVIEREGDGLTFLVVTDLGKEVLRG